MIFPITLLIGLMCLFCHLRLLKIPRYTISIFVSYIGFLVSTISSLKLALSIHLCAHSVNFQMKLLSTYSGIVLWSKNSGVTPSIQSLTILSFSTKIFVFLGRQMIYKHLSIILFSLPNITSTAVVARILSPPYTSSRKFYLLI